MVQHDYVLDVLLEVDVGAPIGQLRAGPVRLGTKAPRAIVALYGADPRNIDPWIEGFYYPQDTLKMTVLTEEGQVLWRRDLGRGVVPSSSFCPAFTLDLDEDGVDEIWFVNNLSQHHPFALSQYRLERVNGLTGETMGRWPWPVNDPHQTQSHLFRHFILGGTVRGDPVLVTAQGTYGNMYLQAWRHDMSERWQVTIAKDAPGARGSHMLSITDLDGDGVEEVMWGERCIELDSGKELFCADRDSYHGHSDIVQPFYDRASKRWFLYTCRESPPAQSPRVVCFDRHGNRIWCDVDRGHMHMGWVARLGPERTYVASAIRIGGKSFGPHGYINEDFTEFNYDALAGDPHPLPFTVRSTYPVDLNGDGYHELVRTFQCGADLVEGEVLDRDGRILGSVGSSVAMASKFIDHPGEQLLAFHPDGLIRVWGDRNAQDSAHALERYAHPLYEANQRLTSGSNHNCISLAGI
jgi:hypothetical protein